jgi:hypothetical protein
MRTLQSNVVQDNNIHENSSVGRPSRARWPLALATIAATVAFATTADAGQRGFMGFGMGGFSSGPRVAVPSARRVAPSKMVIKPTVGGSGKIRAVGVTSVPGGKKPSTSSSGGGRGTGTVLGSGPTVKTPGTTTFPGGGNKPNGKPGGNSGGDRDGPVIGDNGGGKDRPDKDRPDRRWPKFPKPPIIVTAPPIVVATPPVVGVAAVPPASAATVTAPNIVSPQLNPGGRGPSSSGSPRRTQSGVPAANERRYVPDEVVIQLASSVSPQTIDALAQRHNLDRVESLALPSGTTFHRWKILGQRSVPTVIRALETERLAMWVQPNYLFMLQQATEPVAVTPEAATPEAAPPEQGASPGDLEQYAVAKLRLPQAHALAKGDKILIAVIDSAIDTSHPELAGMVVNSHDALGTNEKPHSHGTAIAGAIVANAKLMGAAPRARILGITAFSAAATSAEGTTFAIVKGVEWALSQGARVINMSFAGPRDPALERRIAEARQQGVILVAAAGNAGPKSPPLFPAADPNVIAVTATDVDDKLFQGANRGKHIAVAAPGVDILLPAPDAAYQMTSGTSFAAAEVSGIVALMLERQPNVSPDGVRRALTTTAQDLGPRGFDPQFGAGLVDAYRAVISLAPPVGETAGRASAR